MLYDVTPRDRGMMFQGRSAYIDTAMSWVFPVVSVLMARWARDLGPDKVAILMAVAHMTLGNGRLVCEMPLSIFNKGNIESDECPVFAGLGLSICSARRHMDVLCRDNFLDIYRVLEVKKRVEVAPRLVEINFKTLFDAENLASVGMKIDTPPINLIGGVHEYIHRYFVPSLTSLGLDKSNLFPTAFGASDEAVKAERMLATPKRVRPVKHREESIRDVITRVTDSGMASRQAAATAAVAGDVTKQGVQALIDNAMRTYLPKLPRITVTDKGFSVLRKRLKTANIDDLGDFIDYTIRSWFTIASQNKTAYRKDPTRVERGAAMPSSPNFLTLAYKFPYFLAIYSNHLMDTSKEVKGKTADERRTAILEAQLQQARRENEALRRRTPMQRVRPPPKQQEAQNVVELDDDWEPPEWSGATTKKKA